MSFLGFHRRGRGHERQPQRSERDWGGERKALDWGERRYSRGERFGRERDIGDYYGPERYGAGPERYSSNRYERPEEFGQNRGDTRSDWRTSAQRSERDYGRSDYGRSEYGRSDYGRSGEPTHGAYWSPERTSFSDFGRGGGRAEGSSRSEYESRSKYESSQGTGQYRGRGPKGYRRSDDRVREDVCECLTEDDFIDATNIEVLVKDCEVTLTGTVNSREEKRRAEDLIEDLLGVRDVNNTLRVVEESRGSEEQSKSQAGSMQQQGSRH